MEKVLSVLVTIPRVKCNQMAGYIDVLNSGGKTVGDSKSQYILSKQHMMRDSKQILQNIWCLVKDRVNTFTGYVDIKQEEKGSTNCWDTSNDVGAID